MNLRVFLIFGSWIFERTIWKLIFSRCYFVDCLFYCLNFRNIDILRIELLKVYFPILCCLIIAWLFSSFWGFRVLKTWQVESWTYSVWVFWLDVLFFCIVFEMLNFWERDSLKCFFPQHMLSSFFSPGRDRARFWISSFGTPSGKPLL